jgi:hypothetical protein
VQPKADMTKDTDNNNGRAVAETLNTAHSQIQLSALKSGNFSPKNRK